MDVHARPAEIADEDEVVAIILAAMDTYRRWHPGWTVPADAEERERARWQEGNPTSAWLVGSVEERIVGVSRWVGGEPASLSLLMIDPKHWHLGVGRALHEQTLAGMRRMGARAARLSVPKANLRARDFYERGAWQRTETPGVIHGWLGLCMLQYTRTLGDVTDTS
jgi:GNAT superfamily N-acetyltransferase